MISWLLRRKRVLVTSLHSDTFTFVIYVPFHVNYHNPLCLIRARTLLSLGKVKNNILLGSGEVEVEVWKTQEGSIGDVQLFSPSCKN